MTAQTALKTALLVVISCAFFAGANACAKAVQLLEAGPALHPVQIAFSRFLFGFLTLLPFVLHRGRGVFRTSIPMKHGVRVVFGAAGVAASFAAVGMMPLADALAIAWTSPIFAMVFAILVLKEQLVPLRWFGAAVGLAGVVVMNQPGAGVFQTGAMIALLSALLVGAEVVTIRVLAQSDKPLTILAINNLAGLVISGLAAIPFMELPSWEQMPYLVGVGSIMVCGQLLFIKAAAMGEANFIAPFYYSTLLYAALFGLLFFDEVPGLHLIVGGGMIVASGLVIAFARPRARGRAT
ncbi:DMT family transporter [Nisaea acidiphila]|uniref:DMT family transporter n=1 Tax=Nisaea acidiphila TaxID=1862145 RepID=A0A9J7AVE7_9PROT|nr:DMT family transporter [Nisaea acidiphila]UUX50268.1 DMT family transporter [Nisaea acidiphila]